MFQVREWLFISNYRDSQNAALLQKHNVGALLCLAERIEHPAVAVLYLPVEDGQPIQREKIARGVAFLREQKALGRRAASACGAGISRSTTFAIGALMEEERISWQDAYSSILRHHPQAMPHASLMQSLLEYTGQEVPSFVQLWKTIVTLQRAQE